MCCLSAQQTDSHQVSLLRRCRNTAFSTRPIWSDDDDVATDTTAVPVKWEITRKKPCFGDPSGRATDTVPQLSCESNFRIFVLDGEEDEANSVVFPGGVLQDDNSVNESLSSSWQWPWAASGEINMWNPLLSAMADVVAASCFLAAGAQFGCADPCQ